ncbi:hypothetical protein PF007_g11308 [Phytophthora fragariae]|uniref:Uncharacterized protein n=1 Tax=Phytophthora fragariae TaxID=53985 RepID=A0A6A3SGV9_9STRA|nr:hypothetical protein PF007_g11308 [Phytophthora fragariae]KAE9143821.1 hypothetical protein PF006_g11190 [Phytophthora fragariae]KAE9307831.1 hypothetical protein PF001_g11427 [Phytophthora fragariae]
MQAPSATEDKQRTPVDLVPAQQRLQQPTSPVPKARQPGETRLSVAKMKTKAAEFSDESIS